ncbi:hypothetical protein IMSAG250_00483 [Clostridiales bacterium]|nr:hypothetical protein IMSAG250_00483 [Clostridiales bacterium]
MNLTEAINLAKQGRSVGWGIIIKTTYNRKRFITSKYLASSLDKVLNDSYVKALSSINLLHNPEVFTSWLGIIIASISAAGLRNAGKEFFSENEPYANETLYMDIVNEGKNPVPDTNDFTESEINNFSKKLLKSLNVEQRMCFLYHYIEGFSVKEIARALHCSENDIISSLNAGVKRMNEICDELKKNHPKLAVFSNPLQLFTFVLETEYSYTQNNEVPTEVLNKIIEDTAAIVAEKEIVNEKETEEEFEEDEEEINSGFLKGNKKMIVLIIIIVAIAAGLTIHFVNNGKTPSEPVNNTDKPSESESVSDTETTMDLTGESSSESTSESTSGETSSSSVPVTNQRPNPTQQQPSQNRRPQSNSSTSSSGSSQTSRPQTSSTKPAANTTAKPTQPSTQPSSAPTQPVTEPSTDPIVSEPDFEIPDIE